MLLYDDDGGSSTLRAELNRLRSLLGGQILASRPYRLAADITADWLTVEAARGQRQVRTALRGYRGPLLPRSAAPGVDGPARHRPRDGPRTPYAPPRPPT